MTDGRRNTLSFPPFRLQAGADVLYRDGEVVSLERQAVRVLRYLAEHRDRVVTKEELLDNVWPEVFIADSVLKRAVSLARRALGDDQAAPRFIRTFHRQGYQFIAPVTEALDETPAMAAPTARLTATVVEPERHAPNNLSHPLTTFVGRREALESIQRELTTARLVTLHGPGGMGKTRLATELAREALDTFAGGVWLVELASTSDPALVVTAVAGVLGVREEPARPLAAAVGDAIGEKRVLVVLDNCEQFVDACADLARRLLGHCPNLRVLATSREPLDVPGETVWPVAALDLPEAGEGLSPDRLVESASVRLFLDRAHSARPDFALTEKNADAVAELCRALDGLPLAIELAAARTRTMSVHEILDRMADRFALLARSRSASGERHRTLRATVEWSFDLLSPPEQTMFRRLAAFEDGITSEAAATVCAGPSTLDGDPAELLSHLVDKALVVAEEHGSPRRYRMLESIRKYAAERLHEAGEEDDVWRRHRDWYLDWSERFDLATSGVDEFGHLRAEQGNLRAALKWSLEHPEETGAALRMCNKLAHKWRIIGNWSEGRRWLDILLECADLPPEGRATALALAGALANEQGDYPGARPLLEEAASLHQEGGTPRSAAVALNDLAYTLGRLGEPEAAAGCFAEAYTLLREHGSEREASLMLIGLGTSARESGDHDEALARYTEALESMRRLGDRLNTAVALYNLGELAVDRGEYEDANTLLTESLSIAQELHVPRVEAYTLHTSAFAAIGLGQRVRAAGLLHEALGIHRSQSNDEGVAFVLTGFAMLAVAAGAWVHALRLAGAAEALRDRIGARATMADHALVERALAPARSALGDAAADLAVSAGRKMTATELLAQSIDVDSRPDGLATTAPGIDRHRSSDTAGDATPYLDATRLHVFEPTAPGLGAGATLAGNTLDERYRLESLLGRGGMGEVYRATDIRLGREVAVKTLLAGTRNLPTFLERFEREARVVSRLRHPNIVAVHDVGRTTEDVLYIVMELLVGRSLRQELLGGPMSAKRAVAIMRQVCSGVAAAHAAGVIHRDLKPDNLFLEGGSEDEHVKVLDFGVARLRGVEEPGEAPLTQAGALLGTAHYMSPEQCEARPVDERSDVYALGCILYETVTGEPPFSGASLPELLRKHVYEEPRKPGKIAKDLPHKLEKAIVKALRKEPSERYASAGELGHALAAV